MHRFTGFLAQTLFKLTELAHRFIKHWLGTDGAVVSLAPSIINNDQALHPLQDCMCIFVMTAPFCLSCLDEDMAEDVLDTRQVSPLFPLRAKPAEYPVSDSIQFGNGILHLLIRPFAPRSGFASKFFVNLTIHKFDEDLKIVSTTALFLIHQIVTTEFEFEIGDDPTRDAFGSFS